MIKKLLRAIVIGGLWSVLYISVTRFLFVALSGFDYLSVRDWQVIEYRWNAGAVIKSAHDYSILFFLLMLVPVWFGGWKYLCKLNYVNVLLWPFNTVNKILLKRYSIDTKRILLRNIGAGVKVEEEIKLKTSAIKPEELKNAEKIRNAVSKKLRDEQKLDDI